MQQAAACSDAASTAIAFGAPVAQRFVPSSGSTAMSTFGRHAPSTCSFAAEADLLADVEHRRLVALPFADHDRAVDRHRVEHLRMASTAAWSDLWRSPWPIVWAQAIAACSTTRRKSSERSEFMQSP